MAASVAPDDNVATIYLQSNLDDVHISNIDVKHINQSALTGAAQSSVVRINGIATGAFSCKELSADKIGRFIFSNGDSDGATPATPLSTFEELTAGDVNEPLFLIGSWGASVDNMAMNSIIANEIINMAATGAEVPIQLHIGSRISYSGAEKQIYKTSDLVNGSVTQNGKNMNASVAVSAGFVVTAAHVQNRGTMVRLVAPIASGSIDMGGFPEPYVDGQRISVFGWLNARQDIVLPATIPSIFSDVTFNSATPSHDLVAVSGFWRQAD